MRLIRRPCEKSSQLRCDLRAINKQDEINQLFSFLLIILSKSKDHPLIDISSRARADW